MASERSQPPSPVSPITSIDDQRVIQILSTEHWSLLSARSLAYNEAFARAGMFLSFLSMSFVGLALLAQAMSFGSAFLGIAALVLSFDLIVGLTTFLRINGANLDDLRANHGMARIRHAYTEITPIVTTYFTAPFHDDFDAVSTVYGPGPAMKGILGEFAYAISTAGGMVGLIVGMIGGALVTVAALLVGLDTGPAVAIGVVGGIVVIFAVFAYTYRGYQEVRSQFAALFPTPASPDSQPASELA